MPDDMPLELDRAAARPSGPLTRPGEAATGPPGGIRTVLTVFPGFGVGGAQVRFSIVANHLAGRYRHLVVALNGVTEARERLAECLDISFPTVAVRRGTTLGNLAPFRRALNMLRPDVLMTHNWGSMDWAIANLGLGIPHIHVEDGFGPEERDSQIRRRVLARRVLLRRSVVVLPSRTLERIALNVWRLPRRRLHYVPNGIDLGVFAAAADPTIRASIPGSGPVIGTVTALRPEKRLDRLLMAFASLSLPARLVIVGEGLERASLARLAADLGIAARVHFTGHAADPAGFYAAFDLFALSSDTEQMPLSVIEAMAAGLPVAATDVGDVRVMLSTENSPFVGPRDAAALGRSLSDLAADPALRARVGAANRARAGREYDQAMMIDAYAALLDGAASTAGGGPAIQARTE